MRDARLDVQARQATPLAGLLPPELASLVQGAPALLRNTIRLQVLASGPPDALGLRIVADLGDLRVEAQPTIDLAGGRWAGPITVRHPGAPRVAEALGLTGAPAWLGDGSLAVLANLAGGPGKLAADSFDITAAALHATGQLAFDRTGAVPRVTGQIDAETLPLPLPYPRSPDPLPIAEIAGWQGSVGLRAAHLVVGGSPVLETVSGTLSLADGTLRLEGGGARLGGGATSVTASFDTKAQPPVLAIDARTTGATIGGPLFETSVDVSGGVADGSISLTAAGHSAAALLSTLGGAVRVSVRNGILTGIALAQARDGLSDDAVRAALAAGSTPFDRLQIDARVERGSVVMRDAQITAESGDMRVLGSIDLPTGAADLRVLIHPAVPEPPEIGLRLTGALDAMRRTPELAGVARWRLARDAGSETRAASPADPAGRQPVSR